MLVIAPMLDIGSHWHWVIQRIAISDCPMGCGRSWPLTGWKSKKALRLVDEDELHEQESKTFRARVSNRLMARGVSSACG